MNENRTWKIALWLSILTVLYNLLEGIISVYFGYQDETLALFGFGMDSFIEVLSATGIAHMVVRIQRNPESSRDGFEKTALRITGTSFYLLTIGLVAGAALNAIQGRKPETTFWGIVISLGSIGIMYALVFAKARVGRRLQCEPILADAQCGRVCIYMSWVLLASSLLYKWLGIGFLDGLGALGLAYFSFKEGREAFENANGKECCCRAK